MQPLPTAPRWVALAAVVGLALGGCATAEPDPSAGADPTADADADADATDAADESTPEPALRVATKLAPLADLVSMVGGDRVEVSTLVPPGADSHTYEPRPSDVVALAEADVFVGIGLGLNPGAASLAEQHLPEEAIVLLGERHLDDDALIAGHAHDGDDGHTHDGDDGHTHDDDGHTHDGDQAAPNPHVWTGLPLAAELVAGIAATLEELDPDGAADYRQGAADARTQIEALHADIADAMATVPEDQRTLIVYHDAWGYFARDHGLDLVTAVQPSDHAEPSAGEVRDLIDLIRDHDAPAIFGSEVFPSDVLATIAEETGATYVGDLADDTLPGEPGDPEHGYLGMMRRNAALIVDNLGGDAGVLRG